MLTQRIDQIVPGEGSSKKGLHSENTEHILKLSVLSIQY